MKGPGKLHAFHSRNHKVTLFQFLYHSQLTLQVYCENKLKNDPLSFSASERGREGRTEKERDRERKMGRQRDEINNTPS